MSDVKKDAAVEEMGGTVIPVGESYRVSCSRFQWRLEKRKGKLWEATSYFTSLSGLREITLKRNPNLTEEDFSEVRVVERVIESICGAMVRDINSFTGLEGLAKEDRRKSPLYVVLKYTKDKAFELQIDDQAKLRFDSYQFMVCAYVRRLRKGVQVDEWEPRHFHKTMEAALTSEFIYRIRIAPVENGEYLRVIQRIGKRMIDAVETYKERMGEKVRLARAAD